MFDRYPWGCTPLQGMRREEGLNGCSACDAPVHVCVCVWDSPRLSLDFFFAETHSISLQQPKEHQKNGDDWIVEYHHQRDFRHRHGPRLSFMTFRVALRFYFQVLCSDPDNERNTS